MNVLNDWCQTNDMIVNCSKSNIIHFRNPSVSKTNFIFKCSILHVVDRYAYLGLLLSEHLDFEMTSKFVAQSASRALGLLISKCKLAGGLPFNVYTKLYDSVVYPVISYGAGIWGCINAVQNRAMRFFLGVGKYIPIADFEGEMEWEASFIKQWTSIGRHFVRISRTPLNRINKHIALWAHSKAFPKCKNWFYSIKERLLKLHLRTDYDNNRPLGTEFVNNLQEAGLSHCLSFYIPKCKNWLYSIEECLLKLHLRTDYDINRPLGTEFVNNLQEAGLSQFKTSWLNNIHSAVGPSGKGRNKLRTYG